MQINLYYYQATKDLIINGICFSKGYIFVLEENEYKQLDPEIKKHLKNFIPELNKEENKILFRFS